MKVKVISDTHNRHDKLTDLECDILIHSGDACTKGNYSEADNFLKWFVRQPAKYKIYVRGNHDAGFKKNNGLYGKAEEYGIIMLNNESIYINGRHIWGGHFTSGVKQGVYTEPLIARINAWKDMPTNIDLLVTHVPPLHILDTNPRGEHIGDDKLIEAIKERNIDKHVFGHVHLHGGNSTRSFDTTFYNCACLNEDYELERGYTEIHI